MIWSSLNVLAAVLSTSSLQDARKIPEKPSCASCEIVVGARRLAILDTSSEIPLSGLFTTLATGQYLAAARSGPPRLFDADGRFIRTLGRQGAGPKEFRGTTAFAIGPADSVAIFDGANGHIQILDEKLQVARAFRAEQGALHGGMLWLPRKTSFLLSGVRPTPAEIGFTIHTYATDGSYLWSMAESRSPITPSTSRMNSFRLLYPLTENQVVGVSVAVVGGSYTIESLDLSTRSVKEQFRRESKWFETEPGPFPSRVVSVWVDTAGLLWTLSNVRRPDWEKGAKRVTVGCGSNAERSFQLVDRDLIADSLIEVIDLLSAQLVAQARFDKVYIGRLPNGLLVAEAADQLGFELFAVTLKRP